MPRKKQIILVPDSATALEKECQSPSLTERQERFVAEFLANGGVGSRAARAAGYSNGRDAFKWLMTSEAVLAAIQEARDEARFKRIQRLDQRVELADDTLGRVMKSDVHDRRGWQDHIEAVRLTYESAGILSVHQLGGNGRMADYTRDDEIFRGRTIEELNYFDEHGYFPEEAHMDPAESGSALTAEASEGVCLLPRSPEEDARAGSRAQRTKPGNR